MHQMDENKELKKEFKEILSELGVIVLPDGPIDYIFHDSGEDIRIFPEARLCYNNDVLDVTMMKEWILYENVKCISLYSIFNYDEDRVVIRAWLDKGE